MTDRTMQFGSLVNTGIKVVGDERVLTLAEKTLVIVGVGRGGTSLVSGALHHLGVFTGDTSRAPTFEDVRLHAAGRSGAVDEMSAVVRDYDARHQVWAFKRPASIDYLDQLHPLLRSPVYLFIFKDIFSIANRNAISMQWGMMKGLRRALAAYENIIEFIDRNSLDGLMLSYDRVMQDRAAFVDALIRLAAPQQVSAEQRAAALDFIEPNSQEYLNASRITRGVGTVYRLTPHAVDGSAMYAARPRRPVTVEVFVNGELVGSVDSDTPAKGGQGHAFSFRFPSPLGAGDEVALKLSEDVIPFVTSARRA